MATYLVNNPLTFVGPRALPLDWSRRVALTRQIELASACGGPEELEKGFRLTGKSNSAIVFFSSHDDDCLSTVCHDALQPF